MAINKEFKDLIRLIKYRSGLNQSVIAENLGVTNSYLSDAINGRVPFPTIAVQFLSDTNGGYKAVFYVTGRTPAQTKTVKVQRR